MKPLPRSKPPAERADPPVAPAKGEDAARAIHRRILRHRPLAIALAGTAYLGLWALFYALHLQNRPATPVRFAIEVDVDASNVATPLLRLTGAPEPLASWRIAADVRELILSESPRGQVAVPVGTQGCGALTPPPRTVCGGEEPTRVAGPAELRWESGLQPFVATYTGVTRAGFTAQAGNAGSGGLGVITEGSGGIQACFSQGGSGVLRLQSRSTSGRWLVPLEGPPLSCRGSLRLAVTGGLDRDVIFLAGVRAPSITATAKTLEIPTAASGFVALSGLDREQVVRETVHLRALEDAHARVTVDETLRHASLSAPIFTATSAKIGGEELLTTNLERSRWWLTAAFFGGAGLVWTLIQVGEYLKKRSEADDDAL